MEEAESTTTSTMDDLCPELLESILSRLPLISRSRSKCVSKTWCNLITSLRHSLPPSTSSGLAIFLKFNNTTNNEPNNLHETFFIKHQHHSQYFTLHGSTKHNLPWLIDSCNGLLLYAKHDRNHNWSYYISSPVLDQFIALPQRHKPSILARESLAFNGLNSNSNSIHNNDQFKVICFFFKEVDAESGRINCETFSAQTWEWREHEAPLNNSNLLLEDGFRNCDCFGPSVYSKGRLHWISNLCMLVYDDEREFFNLVRLPKSKSRRNSNYVLSLRLWESEGLIHYCEQIEEGFRLWVYIGDGDEYSYDHDFRDWQAKRTIVLERIGLGLSWPCAFNEELQELYMQVPPGTIVSYSFETGKLAEVWCYGRPVEDYSMSYIYPFMFNSVNLIPRN